MGIPLVAETAAPSAGLAIYEQASEALNQNDYAKAAPLFDQIIRLYPATDAALDSRVKGGYAYLMLARYPEALAALEPATLPAVKPELRSQALLFKGTAQLEQGSKASGYGKAGYYRQAGETFSSLITLAESSPVPTIRALLEDALYNRVISRVQASDYRGASEDLAELSRRFSNSLRRPDYNLLLGNVYGAQVQEALTQKQAPDLVQKLVAQAIEPFDRVSRDPNSLVQANEANQQKAQLLLSVANLSLPSLSGYQNALEAFRKVKRKADMVQIQTERLAKLQADLRAQIGTGNQLSNSQNTLLLNREEERLADLKSGPDPIVVALIGLAQCYNSMKQFDEARTVLHRLARVELPTDQKQQVDFQTIFSYVLGGKTAEADAALTGYLARHPGDKQAEGISVQIAGQLLQRKDAAGALLQADRSLRDFPQGAYSSDALSLKVAALTELNRIAEAKAVIDSYVAQNPGSATAMQMLLSRAQGLTATGDLPGALEAYKRVKQATAAPVELQASGWAGYIQTLSTQQKSAEVVTEAQAFAARFPEAKALPGVLTLAAFARDKLKDPGTLAAFDEVVRRFPKEPAAPYSLYGIVAYYQKREDIAGMAQALEKLRTAYPNELNYISVGTEGLSGLYLKAKQFDAAAKLYTRLVSVDKPELAALSSNKVGRIWLQAAKASGAYKSLAEPEQVVARQRVEAAEQAFLVPLQKYPEQLPQVEDAFQGLDATLQQRRAWGLLRDAEMEAYLTKITASLTAPEMQAHVELAKAGLVFVRRNDTTNNAAALARFKAVVQANPTLALTNRESSRFGELLLSANDTREAAKFFQSLLDRAKPKDASAQADALYGLGAIEMAQNHPAQAAPYFKRMLALPGGAAWHPRLNEAKLGIALAAEQAGDDATAAPLYSTLMQSTSARTETIARALLGYGRILEKKGFLVKAATPGSPEFAVHYYEQVDIFYGTSVPELSAQGLYLAAKAYRKAGPEYEKQASDELKKVVASYKDSAPRWAERAGTEL